MTTPVRTQVETTFAQASVVQAAADLIEDGAGGDLLIEPAGRTIRYQRRDREGAVTQLVQAMAIEEGSGVLSSDLWGAVRWWSRSPAATQPDTTFVLHSDGPLYPTAVPAVADRLLRFSQGCATDEDVRVVRMVGLAPESPLLRSVRLRCMAGPAAAVLAGVRWRLQRLGEARLAGDAGAAARAADRLIQRCCNNDGTPLSQQEAAAVAGVDLAALGGDRSGSAIDGDDLAALDGDDLAALGGVDLAALGGDRSGSAIDGDDLAALGGDRSGSAIDGDDLAALDGDRSGSAIDGDDLAALDGDRSGSAIDGDDLAALGGDRSGSAIDGDDLAALDGDRTGSAIAGRTTVCLAGRDAVVHGLQVAIRRQLAAAREEPLSAAAGRRLLASPGVVVQLSAPGGTAGPGTLLAHELAAAQANNPLLRVVTVERGASGAGG